MDTSQSNYDALLDDEIKRLVINCMLKRQVLQKSGIKRTNRKKGLSVLSGILALFSAGAIASVLVKYFGNEIIQTIAAISAFISGILTLLVTIYYTDDETSKILEGSSKYLDLRERISNLKLNPTITKQEKYEAIVVLKAEYSNLDNIYSQYEIYKIKERRTRISFREFFSPMPRRTYSTTSTSYAYGYTAFANSPYDNISIEETFSLLRSDPELRRKLKKEFDDFEKLSDSKSNTDKDK